MEVNYPTIVTMFYDIRKKENSNPEDNRQSNKYIELAKKFILKLPYPLVIYVDDHDNEEIIDAVNNERSEMLDKTLIRKIKFEETYYYKDIDRLYELQKKFTIFNGDLKHETPAYIVLNNNKHFYIETTIKENTFNSTHFVWMDFGINHVAENHDEIHKWILCVPDKIKQLCINPYIENVENKIMFQQIFHHTAGGLFSGSGENLLKYADLFKKKTEQIYNEDWYQIDEAVMTMVQRENPDLFDFFYGDYKGIVSNYLAPIHNIELILRGIQKCIDSFKNKEAFHILSYCAPYFDKNLNHPYIYYYIQQNIVVNYYTNNRMLAEFLINIIHKKKNLNDEGIINLINNNKQNINYYVNKEAIL